MSRKPLLYVVPSFYSGNGAAQSSNRSDWRTPLKLFRSLDAEFGFTMDAAADADNKLCEEYISKEQDALRTPWKGRVFINPPYDRKMADWIRRCWEQSRRPSVELVVALIPARTDTSYFHDYIFQKAEVRFLRGRQKFWLPGKKADSSPFPSCIVIWRNQ